MSGGRCERHDNWHAECRRCLEEAAYERGIAEGERRERARVVADLRGWEVGVAPGIRRSERALLNAMALRYERGEHTKEGA